MKDKENNNSVIEIEAFLGWVKKSELRKKVFKSRYIFLQRVQFLCDESPEFFVKYVPFKNAQSIHTREVKTLLDFYEVDYVIK